MAAPVADAAGAANTKAKGGPNKLVIGAVLLAALGGGGYWWKGRQLEPEAEASARKKHEVPASARGLVTFDPFVANLADEGGRRFVRATVQLVVANGEAAKEMTETPVLMMQARSIVLDLLTQQLADRLVTPEGKAELRKAITERVGAALTEIEVVDVLFSDFVVQF